MKQITKLFAFAFFLLTAGFVLTSCTNDDNPVVTPPDSGDEPEPEADIKWTYTVLDEDAKTCMLGKSATDAPATTAIDESITGSVTIPESIDGYKVVEINKSAFKGCQISSIIVPNTVTKIGDEAFKRCHSLTTLELGSGVTSVGEDALTQCENLTGVTIFATNPPMVEDQKLFPVDTEHPENTPFNAKLHVPAGCKAAYAAAGGWKDFSQCKGIYEDAVTD